MMKKCFLALLLLIVSCSKSHFVSTEMPYIQAQILLQGIGFVDITSQCDIVFLNGCSLWLDSKNTVLLISLYGPEPNAPIHQMTLGEQGKGFEKWKFQKLKDIKSIQLEHITFHYIKTKKGEQFD